MALALALVPAATYGVADFLGGLASRRTGVLAVVVLSQVTGLVVVLAVRRRARPWRPAGARWRSSGSLSRSPRWSWSLRTRRPAVLLARLVLGERLRGRRRLGLLVADAAVVLIAL